MNYDKFYQDKFRYKIKNNEIEFLKDYLIKKRGFVYIAYSDNNHHLKIGRTGKNPLERARTLSTVGVLHDYKILFALPVFNQFIIEARVHQRLKKYNVSKEFFAVNKDVAIKALEFEYTKELALLERFFDTSMVLQDMELLEIAIQKEV